MMQLPLSAFFSMILYVQPPPAAPHGAEVQLYKTFAHFLFDARNKFLCPVHFPAQPVLSFPYSRR
jgi:hypothetical protein